MRSVRIAAGRIGKCWFSAFKPFSESKISLVLVQFCLAGVAIFIYSSLLNWSNLVGVIPFGELGTKTILYGLLFLCFGLSIIKYPSPQLWPFVILFAFVLVAVLMHEQGFAVRGLMVGTALFLCVGNLILVYHLQCFTSRLMIVMSLIFVAGLMFEVWHPGTFSTTMGRSALMYMNPNLAATGLCLGAFAALHAVPRSFKLSFLIIVFTGILCTLSRSAALGFLLAGSAWIAVNNVWLMRFDRATRRGYLLALVTLVGCVFFVTNAYDKVKAYERATHTAFNFVLPPSGEGVFPNYGDLDPYGIASAEQISSRLARKQLLIRSWDEYWKTPLFGKGLSRAFSLAPHNSYILFAVAVGFLGWLIMPLWLWLIFKSGRAVELKMTAIFLLVIGFFMHDLFTNPALMLAMMFPITVNMRGSEVDRKVCNDG